MKKYLRTKSDVEEVYMKRETAKPNGRFEGVTHIQTIPLFIKKNNKDEIIETKKWFINYNDELIYNIKRNDWINLNMFDDGESVAKEIYIILENQQ